MLSSQDSSGFSADAARYGTASEAAYYALRGAGGGGGSQGAQGAQGAAGAQGAQGSTGSGSQGAQGAQGVQGAAGAQGAQGEQGAQGVTGAQGAAGVQGAAGEGVGSIFVNELQVGNLGLSNYTLNAGDVGTYIALDVPAGSQAPYNLDFVRGTFPDNGTFLIKNVTDSDPGAYIDLTIDGVTVQKFSRLYPSNAAASNNGFLCVAKVLGSSNMRIF